MGALDDEEMVYKLIRSTISNSEGIEYLGVAVCWSFGLHEEEVAPKASDLQRVINITVSCVLVAGTTKRQSLGCGLRNKSVSLADELV